MIGWAMRRMPPASFGWLVAHVLRVAIRARTNKAAARWVGYALLAVLLAFGLFLAEQLKDQPIPANGMAMVIVLTATIILFSFMSTQAVLASQRTLYDANDLDLLFAAPVPRRTVLMAKLCGIAGTIATTFALLMLPVLVPIAALGHPGLFGAVLLLVAAALVAACLGLAVTLVIARIAGPRAARTAGQITAALFGGAVFLITQILNDGGSHRRSSLETVFDRLRAAGVGTQGIASLPGRAAFGDPAAIALLLGGAVALFIVTSLIFQRLFARGVTDAGQHLNRTRASTKSIARHFRTGLFAAVFAKELTLLKRDPALAFQIVLRLVYLVPLFLIGLRSDHHLPLAPSLAFISVTIAGQLVGSFAWLAVSAEDAPDLIMVAPVDKAVVDRIKLGAAMAMATPLAILLPIAITGWTLAGAPITLVLTAAGGAAAGMIELKLGKPAERKSFNRRRPGSFVTRIVTLIVTLVLGFVAGGLVFLVG
jgi:ABC-2 type transport system permease protein